MPRTVRVNQSLVLQQSQVPCYTNDKVKEYRKRIVHLELEYKSFIRKLRRLDTNMISTPWRNKPYQKKVTSKTPPSPLHPTRDEDNSPYTFQPIKTPILDLEANQTEKIENPSTSGDDAVDTDQPLTFKSTQQMVLSCRDSNISSNPLGIVYSSSSDED
ncbi:unnamed protein product [Timema podura]|uniref:Uncharacterized protein n=1 Tax=Timema podura TaxID=61482 RepID=A0ABN7P4U1_TIMPD|nr:unnamed protein product [Timema podura]